MLTRRDGKRCRIAPLAAGLTTAFVWLYAVSGWERVSSGSTKDDSGPLQPGTLLEGQAVIAGEAEQRARMETWRDFQMCPDLLTPAACRNPLLADLCTLRVKNMSGRDLPTFSSDSNSPFWVYPRVENAAGKAVTLPHSGPSALRRLSPIIPGGKTRTLKPGEVVTQSAGFWYRSVNLQDLPKPGRYKVWFDCNYFRAPDGADCEFQTKPFFITITEEHIRQFRELWDAVNNPDGEEEVKPSRPPVIRREG